MRLAVPKQVSGLNAQGRIDGLVADYAVVADLAQ